MLHEYAITAQRYLSISISHLKLLVLNPHIYIYMCFMLYNLCDDYLDIVRVYYSLGSRTCIKFSSLEIPDSRRHREAFAEIIYLAAVASISFRVVSKSMHLNQLIPVEVLIFKGSCDLTTVLEVP